jgi:hypothetical protein
VPSFDVHRHGEASQVARDAAHTSIVSRHPNHAVTPPRPQGQQFPVKT